MTPGNQTSEHAMTWAAIVVAVVPVVLATLEKIQEGGLSEESQIGAAIGAFLAVFAAVAYTGSRTILKNGQPSASELEASDEEGDEDTE